MPEFAIYVRFLSLPLPKHHSAPVCTAYGHRSFVFSQKLSGIFLCMAAILFSSIALILFPEGQTAKVTNWNQLRF